MADLATMLIERLVQLERRLKDLERREYTSGGTTPSSLTVEEEDATPSVGSVDTIQVPNGTLTDDGGGTVSLDYAPSAKGVTNGDSHDHAGGDGAQIDHTGLSNLNSTTYTHLTAANHTDLTDSGATTLHKHDHGGMDGLTDDDHPQYLSYPCNGRLTLESGVPFSTTVPVEMRSSGTASCFWGSVRSCVLKTRSATVILWPTFHLGRGTASRFPWWWDRSKGSGGAEKPPREPSARRSSGYGPPSRPASKGSTRPRRRPLCTAWYTSIRC